MAKLLVAVGSTRRPKVEAVRAALDEIGGRLAPAGAEFEIIGREVSSGVGHTPSSRDELMAGARHRSEMLAEIARVEGNDWRYCVGLEGGLDVVAEGGRRHVFLESWAYVLECGTGRGAFGQSGGVMLPDALASEVLERGLELSAAIDVFAGKAGIRDAQGAWGILTDNLITRQDAFRIGAINAFAPFFNAALYAPH
jgi:non-canonical (house-cleaning) NTP pyrophosphatase